jgi:hypothetical protein
MSVEPTAATAATRSSSQAPGYFFRESRTPERLIDPFES